ncbi:hypothetical protein DMB66_10535 [Actinoplanes sp. ATCC 53533]|uniref:peptidoglycan-binding domain-containing protein n=1 Tax=Actinoplanes sp. ATCC 53533 TaxID=1288362 RepID=UPI000F782B38|nr:peptidoglycan-binding domain-containing protein [Actinoplanes sp. ATCC 53533]RSM69433.1 hypothetical protein DMB66_10535 [Actinoplanes sp. ATCC 53533]
MVGRLSAMGRRRRLLLLLVGTATLCSAVGWVAGSRIATPAETTRDVGSQGPQHVTAPVERRALTNSIVVRGDVRYAATTNLLVDPDVGQQDVTGSRRVVTGRIPAVGTELKAGSVAVEVSGRPVFLLPGKLPMYRSLGLGSRGADVRQLERALSRLGFSPGPINDTFDARTEKAITAWYEAAGYDPVEPRAEERQQLTEAQAQERAARDALAAAKDALAAARRGPRHSETVAAEGEVKLAKAAVAAAIAEREDAVAAAPPAERASVRRAHDLLVLEARNRLAVAEAQLAELRASPNATAEQGAVTRATETLRAAVAAVAALRARVGTRVPRGEVVFLPNLPRRVEQVKVRVGDEPSGPALVLSGADLEVVATVTAAQRRLVSVGDAARLDEESLGIDLPGTVTAVGTAATGSSGEGQGDSQGGAAAEGGFAVTIRPSDADREQADLAGTNVRVTIPVESTDGEVLAVPVAAVSAAADGRSLVRVVRDGGRVEDVPVRVGLSAEGFVEVEPIDGGLDEGDEMVLGLR